MSAYRDQRSGRWRYRRVIRVRGVRHRISGTPNVNTKAAAERAEREHIERIEGGEVDQAGDTPTFRDWYLGRYWDEWCVAEENKPSTRQEKMSIFWNHLDEFFGPMRLHEISSTTVQEFKVELKAKEGRRGPLSRKSRNNILAALSKPLRYAEEVEVIRSAPRVRMYKTERPEIEAWEFEQWSALVRAAEAAGKDWLIALLLAGDVGLRIGEVLALRWSDVDLTGGRVTVARQLRNGIEGTPKGRTRRTVRLTERLSSELRRVPRIRNGRVLCGATGSLVTEGNASKQSGRLCKAAGLPEKGWHVARHTYATHAARFGVNPWALQRWMGHKRIDETMRYVQYADEHPRPVPTELLKLGSMIVDPDERVVAMLGSRPSVEFALAAGCQHVS